MMYLCASQSGWVVNSVLPAGLGLPGLRGRRTSVSSFHLLKPYGGLRFQRHISFYLFRDLVGALAYWSYLQSHRLGGKICGMGLGDERESEILEYLILLLVLGL